MAKSRAQQLQEQYAIDQGKKTRSEEKKDARKKKKQDRVFKMIVPKNIGREVVDVEVYGWTDDGWEYINNNFISRKKENYNFNYNRYKEEYKKYNKIKLEIL